RVEGAQSGTLIGTASVAAPAGVSDLNPGNNGAAVTTPLAGQADLAVAQSPSTVTPAAGGREVLTITVTNLGPSVTSGVTLTDKLTGGFQILSVTTSSGGAAVAGGTVTAQFGLMAPGASATLTVAVRPTAVGNLVSTASAVPLSGTDPVPANSTSVLTLRAAPPRIPIVTGAGRGGLPLVHVYNPDGSLAANFFAFDPGFAGGVRVAAGDVTGDGIPDVVVAAGVTGGPHVKVIDGTKLNQVD